MRSDSDRPEIWINEEGMREGLQIESPDIPTEAKVQLLDALSRTGLRNIVVGSFVSPTWVPQMADIDRLIESFHPVDGVTYTALVLNARGHSRYREHMPPLSEPTRMPRTIVHLCDVFVRRNNNRSREAEIARWPEIVAQAVQDSATEAAIGVNAAWGSNWLGEFTQDQRMDMLRRQYDLWSEHGIAVTEVFLGDPMGWNVPSRVEEQILTIRQNWPSITTFHLHLHNTRGTAPISAYLAIRALDSACRVIVDTSIGGMAGCPYCGNGRAATLIPTEDFVHLLEAEGIRTGINLDKLVETVALAEEIVGHRLYGHVSKAGSFPQGRALYPMDLPFIETLEQAAHFRLGPTAHEGAIAPWREPISSPARAALGLDD
jgi:hydroxymethylglutaryl-CoA lyase